MTENELEGKQVRVVSLDDEQMMELIRGEPLILTNALEEMIVISNGLTREEITEAIGMAVGEENVVLVNRKLDG